MDSHIEESMDEANPGTSWKLRLKRWEESHPRMAYFAGPLLGISVGCLGMAGLYLLPKGLQLVCWTLLLGVFALGVVAFIVIVWRSRHSDIGARFEQPSRQKRLLDGDRLLPRAALYAVLVLVMQAASMSMVFRLTGGTLAVGAFAVLVAACIIQEWRMCPRPFFRLCFMLLVAAPLATVGGFCVVLGWIFYLSP